MNSFEKYIVLFFDTVFGFTRNKFSNKREAFLMMNNALTIVLFIIQISPGLITSFGRMH